MVDIVFRFIVFIGLATIAVLVAKLIISGRTNRLTRLSNSVPRHRNHARWLLSTTALLVVLIESKVRMNGGVHPVDMLFGIHLFFAICFFAGLLVLNFWLTGEKSRREKNLRHAVVAYCIVAPCSLGMIGTGFFLIFRI